MKNRARAIVRKMRVENLPAAHRHGERQRAAREALGVAGDVRDNFRLFTGEQRSGSAKAGHHLVRDEQHAMARANILHFAQSRRRIDHHAARAQNQRLRDKGRRAIPAGRLQRIETLLLAPLVRKGNARNIEQ